MSLQHRLPAEERRERKLHIPLTSSEFARIEALAIAGGVKFTIKARKLLLKGLVSEERRVG